MGLTSSPAVATMAERYAARKTPPPNGKQWIREDDLLDPHHLNRTRKQDAIEKTLSHQFYVDDFLHSEPTPKLALSTIHEAISRLQRYQMKLCKVQLNAELVRRAFPNEGKTPTKIDLSP